VSVKSTWNLQNKSKIKVSKLFLSSLEKQIKKLLSKKRIRNKRRLNDEVTILFLDKSEAKKINKNYRQKNYPTDVLSFMSDDPEMGLGDLVICLAVVREQANRHGLSFNEELSYVVLHGFLHLLGYDHERSKREDRVMMKLQDEVFEGLF
jgi:probable rRNA maturation factor